jgi:predicted transcriptional regulator
MNRHELAEIGRELYGPAWKAKLAKELGRSRFTVYRWAAGKTEVSGPAAERIRELRAQKGGKDAKREG